MVYCVFFTCDRSFTTTTTTTTTTKTFVAGVADPIPGPVIAVAACYAVRGHFWRVQLSFSKTSPARRAY